MLAAFDFVDDFVEEKSETSSVMMQRDRRVSSLVAVLRQAFWMFRKEKQADAVSMIEKSIFCSHATEGEETAEQR